GLPPMQVAARLESLTARLDEAEVDALVVTTLPNVRYLTGFSGSAGVLLVTADRALLTTDGRYRTQSGEQVAASGVGDRVDVEIGGVQAQRDAVKGRLAGLTRVGLEADNVTWEASRRWADLLEGAEVKPTTGVVEALREVKDEGEIARMARAAAIADSALAEVLGLMGTGITETEFALALDTAMRRGGAESTAFDTIVAAGPNSAKPHHQPTDRRIDPGDPVVVDFGATFEGYRSDMTRTFCVGGEPTGDLARVFDVVRASQADGVAAVRPGAGTKEVDDVCRAVIAQAGWADAFEHGTGHGVGLDIHEAPTVSPLGTAILSSGVVVTVEPGVYLPGIGGVRIEDTLVVTEDGSRPLTTFTKEVAA
ncbi:MAG TPA: aminopeptidase P family protein, partial [Acidimicrobiales bacterium]|nr:aminopeptidase P family protein [Acidimicrobiales bacterium]